MKTILKLLRRCDFTICRNSSGLKSIFGSFLDCIITDFQNLIQDKFVVDESKMTITDSQFVETLKNNIFTKNFVKIISRNSVNNINNVYILEMAPMEMDSDPLIQVLTQPKDLQLRSSLMFSNMRRRTCC